MKPHAVAQMTIHRLPNLSEMRPNRMIEIAPAVVHIMENKLALALGPRLPMSCRISLADFDQLADVCIDHCDDCCSRRKAPVARSTIESALIVCCMLYEHNDLHSRQGYGSDGTDQRQTDEVALLHLGCIGGKSFSILDILQRAFARMCKLKLLKFGCRRRHDGITDSNAGGR